MIPRALIAGLCAVALFAPLAGAGDAELTKIKVGFLAAEPAALVTYAKHRGMFTKQGIDAEMVPRTDPRTDYRGAPVRRRAVQRRARRRRCPAQVQGFSGQGRRRPERCHEPKNPTSALVAPRGSSIKRPRDLVGKTILIDGPNTIAHIGVLKWLKRGGVSKDDVKINFVVFPDMLASLSKGDVDAAFLPEPYITEAVQRGSKVVAYPFNAVCSKVCVITFWMARADVDANVVARFRNAIQNAAVWANQDKNDAASAKILARYVTIDAKVLAKMKRSSFGTRLRPSLAQPWLDAFAEFGVIPAGFKAIDLVK